MPIKQSKKPAVKCKRKEYEGLMDVPKDGARRYDFQRFLKACKGRGHEGVDMPDFNAAKRAREDFGLDFAGIRKVLISNECKNMSFHRCEILKQDHGMHSPPVDGYRFTLDTKKGYLAFYLRVTNGLFIIKSFHKDEG